MLRHQHGARERFGELLGPPRPAPSSASSTCSAAASPGEDVNSSRCARSKLRRLDLLAVDQHGVEPGRWQAAPEMPAGIDHQHQDVLLLHDGRQPLAGTSPRRNSAYHRSPAAGSPRSSPCANRGAAPQQGRAPTAERFCGMPRSSVGNRPDTERPLNAGRPRARPVMSLTGSPIS